MPQIEAPPVESIHRVSEPVSANGLLLWEEQAHRGDWIGFKLWLACAGMVIAMNVFDLIRGWLGL